VNSHHSNPILHYVFPYQNNQLPLQNRNHISPRTYNAQYQFNGQYQANEQYRSSSQHNLSGYHQSRERYYSSGQYESSGQDQSRGQDQSSWQHQPGGQISLPSHPINDDSQAPQNVSPVSIDVKVPTTPQKEKNSRNKQANQDDEEAEEEKGLSWHVKGKPARGATPWEILLRTAKEDPEKYIQAYPNDLHGDYLWLIVAQPGYNSLGKLLDKMRFYHPEGVFEKRENKGNRDVFKNKLCKALARAGEKFGPLPGFGWVIFEPEDGWLDANTWRENGAKKFKPYTTAEKKTLRAEAKSKKKAGRGTDRRSAKRCRTTSGTQPVPMAIGGDYEGDGNEESNSDANIDNSPPYLPGSSRHQLSKNPQQGLSDFNNNIVAAGLLQPPMKAEIAQAMDRNRDLMKRKRDAEGPMVGTGAMKSSRTTFGSEVGDALEDSGMRKLNTERDAPVHGTTGSNIPILRKVPTFSSKNYPKSSHKFSQQQLVPLHMSGQVSEPGPSGSASVQDNSKQDSLQDDLEQLQSTPVQMSDLVQETCSPGFISVQGNSQQDSRHGELQQLQSTPVQMSDSAPETGSPGSISALGHTRQVDSGNDLEEPQSSPIQMTNQVTQPATPEVTPYVQIPDHEQKITISAREYDQQVDSDKPKEPQSSLNTLDARNETEEQKSSPIQMADQVLELATSAVTPTQGGDVVANSDLVVPPGLLDGLVGPAPLNLGNFGIDDLEEIDGFDGFEGLAIDNDSWLYPHRQSELLRT
jgi:hypothetical protein